METKSVNQTKQGSSPETRICRGINCVKAVYSGEAWTKWANDWLSGKDRSGDAAWVAAAAAMDDEDLTAEVSVPSPARAARMIAYGAARYAVAWGGEDPETWDADPAKMAMDCVAWAITDAKGVPR